MKKSTKLVALLLSALLALPLTACGDKTEDTPKTSDGAATSEKTSGDNTPGGDFEANAKEPLDLLNAVWSSYTDDEKFPVAGGDMSEENMNMEGPGKFGIGDKDALDATLGFPAAAVDKITAAASLMHMMNANTFTCGAYSVKNAGDVTEVANALKDNIMQRQWICGFPDKLVIVSADGCVIAFFGENETVNTFNTKLQAACASATVICDEAIA